MSSWNGLGSHEMGLARWWDIMPPRSQIIIWRAWICI